MKGGLLTTMRTLIQNLRTHTRGAKKRERREAENEEERGELPNSPDSVRVREIDDECAQDEEVTVNDVAHVLDVRDQHKEPLAREQEETDRFERIAAAGRLGGTGGLR